MRPAALALLLAAAGPASADDATVRLGQAIFTGATHTLTDDQRAGLPERQITRHPCAGCHGRDGRGGTEGAVPPVLWESLAERTAVRGPYTPPGLHHAMTNGEDPEGRTLSRLMPRYALPPEATAAVQAYLAALPAIDRAGVAPARLTVCVVAPLTAATTMERYARRLSGTLTLQTSPQGVHGRRPEVSLLHGDATRILADAEAGCLAVVGLLPGSAPSLEALTGRGVPVLFPLFRLAGDEDVSIVRSIVPSGRDLVGALVDDLAERGGDSIHVARGEGAGAIVHALRLDPRTLSRTVGEGPPEAAPRDAALVVPEGAVPDNLTGGRSVWLFAAAAANVPEGIRARVIVEAPDLIAYALAEGLDPLEAQAALAAEVLAEALKVAGRGVGRAALLSAFESAALGRVGLDYAATPLTGTSRVVILPVGPED